MWSPPLTLRRDVRPPEGERPELSAQPRPFAASPPGGRTMDIAHSTLSEPQPESAHCETAGSSCRLKDV